MLTKSWATLAPRKAFMDVVREMKNNVSNIRLTLDGINALLNSLGNIRDLFLIVIWDIMVAVVKTFYYGILVPFNIAVHYGMATATLFNWVWSSFKREVLHAS